MSSGEQLYLALVLGTFVGFGLWLGYNSWRYDQASRTRQAVARTDAPADALHAG